jgi:hypothetical protein
VKLKFSAIQPSGAPAEQRFEPHFLNPTLGGLSKTIETAKEHILKPHQGDIVKKIAAPGANTIVKVLMNHLHVLNAAQNRPVVNLFSPATQGVELTLGVENRSHSDLTTALKQQAEARSTLFREKNAGQAKGPATTGASAAAPQSFEQVLEDRLQILSEEDRKMLLFGGEECDRDFDVGASVLEQGKCYDSVFMLLRGSLKTRIGDEEFDLALGPGMRLNVFQYVRLDASPFSVYAKTPVRLRELSRAWVRENCEIDPGGGARYMETLTYDLCNLAAIVWSAMYGYGNGIHSRLVKAFLEGSKKGDREAMHRIVVVSSVCNE